MTWPNTATACAASISTSKRRPPVRCWPASAGVIEAVRDIDSVAVSYRDAYQRFAARFSSLDDGKAAARICDRLFAT